MEAWRLTMSKHARRAFDGEGARLHGGRWNHAGLPAVYVAATVSLAALEYLAGVDVDLAPEPLVVIPVAWDAGVRTEALEPGKLPGDWRTYPHPESTRTLGDAWLERAATAVLSVPSAIVPQERIYVLNPRHPKFAQLRIGPPQPFAYDPRLW